MSVADIKGHLTLTGKLDWYHRAKAKNGRADQPPLEDQACSDISVYLVRQDGSLWTIQLQYESVTQKDGTVLTRVIGGTRYKQVREPNKPIPRDQYLCLHCKAQSDGLPVTHISKEVI